MRELRTGDPIGLVKFFNNREYMKALQSGLIHCQTPARYRLDQQEGIGDRFESCIYSWDRNRDNEEPLSIHIKPAESAETVVIKDGLIDMTMQSEPDRWLHCWMGINIPGTPEEFEDLLEDIEKMKLHFGRNYLFLPTHKEREFAQRITEASKEAVDIAKVLYSDEKFDWSPTCKARKYAYQREVRFLFGECSPNELEPYVFTVEQGLQDLLWENLTVEIHTKHGKYPVLTPDGLE